MVHFMERKILKFLQKWKNDLIRKPLLIYGPKQIGKTFCVLDFGSKNYKNVVYFNCDYNPSLLELFKREKAPDKIILNLSLMSKETILKEDTLLVFDNINELEIIKGIKLLGSERREYHIILITSRRENLIEFKGEELQFKGMSEMDFEEYLWAHNEHQLAALIRESYERHRTCPFHKVALDYF